MVEVNEDDFSAGRTDSGRIWSDGVSWLLGYVVSSCESQFFTTTLIFCYSRLKQRSMFSSGSKQEMESNNSISLTRLKKNEYDSQIINSPTPLQATQSSAPNSNPILKVPKVPLPSIRGQLVKKCLNYLGTLHTIIVFLREHREYGASIQYGR